MVATRRPLLRHVSGCGGQLKIHGPFFRRMMETSFAPLSVWGRRLTFQNDTRLTLLYLPPALRIRMVATHDTRFVLA
jgi:hypothetical protein